MNFLKTIKKRRKTFIDRELYCTNERELFFKVAEDFLPDKVDSLIVDIGAGDGAFSRILDLDNRYENLYQLDGNSDSVRLLKQNFKNVREYRIPHRLPFDDSSVFMIHNSHVIEHLTSKDLYDFLKEIDRCLINEGYLILSSPLLWPNFYHDMSHLRPYYPETIMRYLSFKSSCPTSKHISDSYECVKLIYRYYKKDYFEEGTGCSMFYFDFLIHGLKHLLKHLRIQGYEKNGYTMVLRKKMD